MKFRLLIFILLYSICSYSQCFDCGHSIGGHVEDYVVDIDQASDGVILTFNPNQGWGRSIYKYDFNCNLIWSNNFEPDNSLSSDGISFLDTTLDSSNNIYSIIRNSRGGEVVEGFTIESGSSLIKMNSDGNIVWIEKISDSDYLKRKVHVWLGNVYVTGQIDEGGSTNIGLTVPDGFRSQHFIAKFDALGNLIGSEQFGSNANERFLDSQIDKNGNIYFTGLVVPVSNTANITSNLSKVDSNLELLWSREISNNPPDRLFEPMTLHYNDFNDKLYIWSKYSNNVSFYSNNITVSGNCNVGSVILEISRNTGNLENYKVIDNCGFFDSVGNGTGNVEQRTFMANDGSNLYFLSSFRGEITIGNQTINTTQTIHNEYNSDLILYRLDLTTFSTELIFRSTGENYYPSAAYYDLAGPIVAIDNSIYVTSSFMSYPMTINGNTIINNSGNNNRDILYYKYNLNQDSPNGLISFENTCFSETTTFELNGFFDSVIWNFDDPASGADNTSTLINPNHLFTSNGTFNVSAIVTCATESESIDVTVTITDSPTVNQIGDLYACEDIYGTQISNTFDSASVENDIIGNQSNLNIQYFDQSGNELPNPLPNPMANTIQGQETITAQISSIDNPTCYTEVSFNLIVQPLPALTNILDLGSCENSPGGFANFDLTNVESIVLGGQTGMTVSFFDGNGNLLPNPLPNPYINSIPNQEIITVRVTNEITNCSNETTLTLNVNEIPTANPLDTLIGCDDNADGISEYFDTSNVENQVIGSQTGMDVSYFDSTGNILPSPLPNPFTNTEANSQDIIVRVTNSQTDCYSETILTLETAAQPNINQPDNLYACDEGDGFAYFDTSNIESTIIGNQTGLDVYYFDENDNILPSPLPTSFLNTTAYNQTIYIRVENTLNTLCYSETSFELVVNTLPQINLEEEYLICNLDPSITISVANDYHSYSWYYDSTELISETHQATLIQNGNYTLMVSELLNDIECENTFNFTLSRSVLPEIAEVEYEELGNNFIRILATGDGDFEYSIDGVNYQDNNYFNNIPGGTYTAYVRDKYGCGEDSQPITLIDYPSFFTPNNDGFKDTWHIYGISNYTSSKIYIFDRYGKLLKQLNPSGLGWDGTFNGEPLDPNDFWFSVDLTNDKRFEGHFALKR